MRIEFRILGVVDLRADEDGHTKAIDLPPKIRALLAYLALARPARLHARDTLTALFWPELDQEHARSNLRQALYVLRRQLGPEALVTRGQEEVGLDRQRFWCDAMVFDELAREDPEGALTLYRGELLPATHLDGSAEFERWLETERTRLRDRAMVALGEVAGRAESEGQLAEAVRWRRKALEIDPYDEEALRRLVALRARLGDRAGALQAYDAFERRVREDLDLEPDEATRALEEAVRGGKIAVDRPTGVLPELVRIAAETSPEPRTPVAIRDSTVLPIDGTSADASRKRVSRFAGAAILASLLLVGLVSLYFVTQDRQVSRAPGEGVMEAAAAGIAVMPFEVSGAELEEWREGMVVLLSTGLDGAGSLRAIDTRTVLAQWDRRAPGRSRADRETALEVAAATDARYAVLGSAVRVGPELRLVADVFSVDDGARLGTAQAEGSPDNVLALTDELARGVLGVILDKGKGEIPPVHLAALTTNSLPALKAFLEGEALYRRGRIEESVTAYDRAVETDSTFALAWNRLATAYSWLAAGQYRFGELSERAMRHADRLPARARLFVEIAYIGHTGSTFEGLDLVRGAVRKYPDDAHAWFDLGEYYLHFKRALAGLEEAEAAFLKAVELDPTFAPYRYHLVELAFTHPPDSALAAERVRELTALDPDGLYARAGRLAWALAFGDPVHHPALLDSIRSLDPELIDHLPSFLRHPRFWELEEEILKIAVDKGYSHPDELFWGSILKRGRVADALQYIDMPGGPSSFPTRQIWEAHGLGIPIPEAILESHLAMQAADSTAGLLTAIKGFYALDRGRSEDYVRSVAVHRRAVARGHAEGDSALVRGSTAILHALEGYDRWKNGDPSGALPLLLDGFRNSPGLYPYPWALWIGRIYLELGRPVDAVPYFQARRAWWYATRDPLAEYYAGVAFEQAGELEKARRAYSSLVEHWRDPDPELRPVVEQARQAMIRVGGAR